MDLKDRKERYGIEGKKEEAEIMYFIIISKDQRNNLKNEPLR